VKLHPTYISGGMSTPCGGYRSGPATDTLHRDMASESKHEDIAARIRALRGSRPQPQIADEVGVTLRAYQEWEAGGGIAWPNLRKLAEVHRVSTNWLEHGDEQPERAHSQLDRIEQKLDKVLARLGAVTVEDLFETPRDKTGSAQGERRESQGQRAG
jgi:hypothetical protein